MLYAVNKAEEERAIRYLMDNIPKDCMEKVMDKIQNEGDRWLLSQHLRFGMYIRNTLREGGFNWNSLDYMWTPLIKKAVRIMQYKFGPASPKDKIVFGANRPGKHGHDSEHVALAEVQEWIDFMKDQKIQRICCLLPKNQLKFYDDIDLLKLYREEFGQDNICWADIEDFHLCDKDKLLKKILPFLKESERNKKKVVVHCSGGSGRTGHVLAAWLVYQHGLSVEEAISTVRGMGREPCEAVFANKATEDELINLLDACKCSILHCLNSLLLNFFNYIENKDISNAMIVADRIIRKSHSFRMDTLYTEPSVVDKETFIELARRVRKIKGKFSIDYLFCWDDVPGNDNDRLMEFLKREFGICWEKTAKIEKLDSDKTIRVSFDNKYIYLRLNDNRTELNLEIADYRTEQFNLWPENGKLSIYSTENKTGQLEFWTNKIRNYYRKFE